MRTRQIAFVYFVAVLFTMLGAYLAYSGLMNWSLCVIGLTLFAANIASHLAFMRRTSDSAAQTELA